MGLLIDLSAWARSSAAADRWRELVERGDLRCHPVFAIELLHNARDEADYLQLRQDINEAFDWVWPDDETTRIAMRMQSHMATQATGQRVKTADLLIAALAVQHELGVIHYDRDYDQIRDRGGHAFESHWLAPRGSLETAGEAAVTTRRTYRKAFGARMIQLQDDTDLEVWPDLIKWMDRQLRERGLEVPPAPDLP